MQKFFSARTIKSAIPALFLMLVFFLLLFVTSTSNAKEKKQTLAPPLCPTAPQSVTTQAGLCPNCVTKSAALSRNGRSAPDLLPQELLDYGLLLKATQSATQRLNQLADSYKPIARYISPLSGLPASDKAIAPPELAVLRENAEKLKVLYSHQDELKKKIEICQSQQCPRSWVLDDTDERQALDPVINMILAAHPILASEGMTEYLMNAQTKFENKTFEKTLYGDFADFFNSLSQFQQTKAKIARLAREENPNRTKPFLELVLNEIPLALPLVQTYAESTPLNEPERVSYCRIQAAQKNLDITKTSLNISINAAFLLSAGAPLVGSTLLRGSLLAATRSGAVARGGVSGIRSGLAMTSGAEAGVLVTTILGQEVYGLKSMSLVNTIRENCRHLNAARFAQTSDLNKYRQCLADESDAKVEAIVAAGSLGLSSASPMVAASLKQLQRIQNENRIYRSVKAVNVDDIVTQVREHPLNTLQKKTAGYQFNTKTGTTFTYLDLSKSNVLKNTELHDLPTDYWNYVRDVYSQKLNLSPEEIKEFIDESHSVASRSKLLVASKGAPQGQSNLVGGITVVESKSPQELLPLEIATGMRLPRPSRKSGDAPGKVVELGRLIVTERNGGPLLGEIFNIAVNNHLRDPEITHFYAITSKTHVRLYRRSFNFNITPHPNGRDVILDSAPENLLKPQLAPLRAAANE